MAPTWGIVLLYKQQPMLWKPGAAEAFCGRNVH
jgi:hypothetical protein